MFQMIEASKILNHVLLLSLIQSMKLLLKKNELYKYLKTSYYNIYVVVSLYNINYPTWNQVDFLKLILDLKNINL